MHAVCQAHPHIPCQLCLHLPCHPQHSACQPTHIHSVSPTHIHTVSLQKRFEFMTMSIIITMPYTIIVVPASQ